MSMTNQDIKQKAGLNVAGGKNKKDYFTLLQASVLIVLTIAISIGGWYVVGQKYFWTGRDEKRISEQLAYLEKQVQANPKDPQMRVDLGYTYFIKGDNTKAIRELSQVVELDKKNFNGFYNLGLVYLDENRLDEALEQFQKCIELSPRDYKGYMQKGIAYRKLKMYKDALSCLNQASKLKPGGADIIYEVGMVVEAQGDKKGAAAIYKDALRYDPLYKDAADALKRVQ